MKKNSDLEENFFETYKQKKLDRKNYRNFKEFINNSKYLQLNPRREGDYTDDKVNIQLFDAKVYSKGPDDKIYGSTKIKNNERIRDEVTRGCILLEVERLDTKEKEYFIFQGFSKFSGLTDQDDDDLSKLVEKEKYKQSNLDIFFTESKFDSTKIVKVSKENGKACHASCFIPFYDETKSIQQQKFKKYYVCGSKNVHVVFKNSTDVKGFGKPHVYHNRFSRIFLDTLSRLDKDDRLEIEEMLIKTGLLMNFEVMLKDSQHIVSYDFGKKDYILKFLAFTGRRTFNDEYKKKYGKTVPVDIGLKYAEKIGFEIADYEEINVKDVSKEEFEKIISSIRDEENSEGSVIYFLKDFKVIGLCKTKSVWYIFFRAIREKLKIKKNNIKRFNCLIKRRFNDIQTWLKVSDEDIRKWRVYAHHFFKYMKSQISKKEKNDGNMNDILRSTYADHVDNFLKNVIDKKKMNFEEEIKIVESNCDESKSRKGGGKFRNKKRNRNKKKEKNKRKNKNNDQYFPKNE